MFSWRATWALLTPWRGEVSGFGLPFFPTVSRLAQVLSVEPGFGNTGADSLAEDFVLELSEVPERSGHGAARRRRQIQRLGERHETDAQRGEFLQSDNQIDE